jgi:palmitoyltransferase
MGRNPWWWFREFLQSSTGILSLYLNAAVVPIGHGASDGLNYDPNPRFDEQGRWRPRKEWPVELQ